MLLVREQVASVLSLILAQGEGYKRFVHPLIHLEESEVVKCCRSTEKVEYT
jgi:hypothetical protein